MKSLEKILMALCIIGTKIRVIGNSLLSVMIIVFASFTASAQEKATIKAKMYHHIVKPDAMVKVQTLENGIIKETNNVAIKNVQVPADNKTVISYADKISVIDTASYKRLKANPQILISQENLKIIPELYIDARSSVTGAISYRIVFTSLQPFRYIDSLKKFSARMGFFLMPEPENSNVTILEPVNIEVVSGEVSAIRPDHLQISHLNLPSSDIELTADDVSDSAKVKVITAFNPDGYTTYLKVKPTMEIFTNRSVLQGMGIQKIPVNIRLRGSNSPDSVKVTFSVEKGTINPNSVYVSYNSPSTVFLNSEGIGDTRLSASSSNLRSNDLNFAYVFPWVFLFASILGGLIGSLAKYYLNQEIKKFSLKPIIGGILIGFIGAVAYYVLGVNLLGISISAGFNELAVFGFSGLCAYFGISLLNQVGN